MSSNMGKMFNLPSSEEMLQRLLKVNNYSLLQQKFYPLLTKHAGQRMAAVGVVMILQQAIYEYTKGMTLMEEAVLRLSVKGFIDALCPDAEIAAEAKASYAEAMQLTLQG